MGQSIIVQEVKVLQSDIVTVAAPNKILKLDTNSKLPTSITGDSDGNSATTTKLATARTVSLTGDATGSVSFDGSADASIATTLANSGVTAGTYKSVSVNAKGLVTAGTNPTTLAGFGITDAVNTSSFNTNTSTNGYLVLPTGVILQWMTATMSNGATTNVSFPMTFPNTCLSHQSTNFNPTTGATAHLYWANGLTTSVVSYYNNTGNSMTIKVFAIGY